jgi:acyl-coenzyme A thioesterase PaaI-like protein
MADFSTATAVVPREGVAGIFDVDLDTQWSAAGKLHGGYLLAILGRAAAALPTGHPHLAAISGCFVQSPEPGPAEVTAEVLRVGRATAQVRVRLSQAGLPRVEALITQGRLDDSDPWWSGLEPVSLPPLSECPRSSPEAPGGAFRIPMLEVVEQYLDPAVSGFKVGAPTGKGRYAGWLRLADGTDWDPLSLVMALDALPPLGYDIGAPGWAPTLQFNVYVRRLPAPGPIRVSTSAHEAGSDRIDASTFAWDSKGRLVAQGSQLAGFRIPA